MSERSLWKTVRTNLSPFGKLDRVENRAGIGVGTPDVHYVLRRGADAEVSTGWVELKFLPDWPRRSSTPVCIPKLTAEQVWWAEEHMRAGERVWMLLRVGGPAGGYGLFNPVATRMLYDRRLYRTGLIEVADVWSEGPFPVANILKVLTKPS